MESGIVRKLKIDMKDVFTVILSCIKWFSEIYLIDPIFRDKKESTMQILAPQHVFVLSI